MGWGGHENALSHTTSSTTTSATHTATATSAAATVTVTATASMNHGEPFSMSHTLSTNTHTTLFFAEWTTNTAAEYALTLLFLFALGVFSRFLGALRHQLEQRWKEQAAITKKSPTTSWHGSDHSWGSTIREPKRAKLGFGKKSFHGGISRPLSLVLEQTLHDKPVGAYEQQQERRGFWTANSRWNLGKETLRSAIEFVRSLIGIVQMLAIMTYNVGFLFAVTGSVLVAEFIFGRYG